MYSICCSEVSWCVIRWELFRFVCSCSDMLKFLLMVLIIWFFIIRFSVSCGCRVRKCGSSGDSVFIVNESGVLICRWLLIWLCCLVMLCFSVFSVLSR